jgi:hypothetical protein
MTIGLTVNDNRIEPAASRLVLPGTLPAGLQFLHIMTGGLSLALRNWADGMPAASVGGAPAESAGHLDFVSGSSWLQTQMSETADLTFLSVARSLDTLADLAHDPILIGNYAGGGDLVGVALFQGANNSNMNSRSTNGTVRATNAAGIADGAPGANWACRIGSTGTGLGSAVYQMTTGVQVVAAPAAGYTARSLTNANKVRIGSGYDTAFKGSSQHVVAAAWNRVLTADERAAAYQWAKALSASVGIAA